MNLIDQINREQTKKLGKDIPDFAPGDTLRIGYKVSEGTRSRVQNYEGVVISRKGGIGISASFTVRKVSFGEGVERIFPLHSPNIDKSSVSGSSLDTASLPLANCVSKLYIIVCWISVLTSFRQWKK